MARTSLAFGDRVHYREVWVGNDEVGNVVEYIKEYSDRGTVVPGEHGGAWVLWDTGECDLLERANNRLDRRVFSEDVDDEGRERRCVAVRVGIVPQEVAG